MPREFARIHLAVDGEQVLFVVDIDEETGLERFNASTLMADGRIYTHRVSFELPGLAGMLLKVADSEQIELTRRLATQEPLQ